LPFEVESTAKPGGSKLSKPEFRNGPSSFLASSSASFGTFVLETIKLSLRVKYANLQPNSPARKETVDGKSVEMGGLDFAGGRSGFASFPH
jgi:hypothetical protein